jgi:hypothetical protein
MLLHYVIYNLFLDPQAPAPLSRDHLSNAEFEGDSIVVMYGLAVPVEETETRINVQADAWSSTAPSTSRSGP